MQVWDGITGASIHFDANELTKYDHHNNNDSTTIAYMIENIHLQHALLKRLEQCRTNGAQVDILQKARVSSISDKPVSINNDEHQLDLSDWPLIQLENGTELRAKLLVNLYI